MFIKLITHKLYRISVRLGEWDLNRHIDCDLDLCAPPAQDIIIQEKIAHENYIPQLRSQYYDIALLRLARKVEYSGKFFFLYKFYKVLYAHH